jgi:phosphate transport system substrate-binding protein
MHCCVGCLIALFIFLSACTSDAPKEELDTPTSGAIRVFADEAVQPLTEQLIETFKSSYPKAFLNTSFYSENAVINGLTSDSCRFAVLTRSLTTEELAYFKAKTFGVEQVKIGYDAVAFITNKNNSDSIFTNAQIQRLLLGQDSIWSQVKTNNTLGRITVVLDSPGSSAIRFLSDSLLQGKTLGRTCFAVNSNQSVVDYVNAHANAIGVVGLNWIGDKDNSSDQERLNSIRIAAIGNSLTTAVIPNQSALALQTYPFRREIYLIKIGMRAGLGTGFASFAYSDRGQLIVQKCGLLPAKPAERRIKLKSN